MASFQVGRVREGSRQDRLLQSCASSKLLPEEIEPSEENLQTTQIALPPPQLQHQLALYHWRAKTELPLVRVHDCALLSQTPAAALLRVRTEALRVRLPDLKELPLFKLLYLLKETLIGMERLCDRFGPFEPSPRLVGLTPAGRCKVWLCENFASNCPAPLAADEGGFLRRVLGLFECGNRLRNTLHFQQELANCRSFCQALAFIENYARENRIAIPSACRLTPKEMVNPHECLAQFDPSMTLTRAPKFLQNASLRISLKTNSRHLYHLARSPLRENEEESHSQIRMKTSGDTAPDLFGSQEAKQVLDQSLTFDLTRVKSKNTLTFSNERERVGVKVGRGRGEREGEESEEEERAQLESVFSRNHWQRRLQGLFGEGGMKKSIHKGKEKRNTEKCALKLHLLDSLGKNLQESYIHDDHVPYTSEF